MADIRSKEIRLVPIEDINADADLKLFGCYMHSMTIQSTETVRMFLGNDEIQVEYRDLHWFGKFKFYVTQGRGQSKYLIANLPDKSRTIQLHQLIMKPPKGLEVDHINNNGLDNRRANLRIVNHQANQNNQPKKRGASSKFYGVSWEKSRARWLCQVRHDGITTTVGRFDSEVEAAVAYNNAIIKKGIEGKKRLNPL